MNNSIRLKNLIRWIKKHKKVIIADAIKLTVVYILINIVSSTVPIFYFLMVILAITITIVIPILYLFTTMKKVITRGYEDVKTKIQRSKT